MNSTQKKFNAEIIEEVNAINVKTALGEIPRVIDIF